MIDWTLFAGVFATALNCSGCTSADCVLLPQKVYNVRIRAASGPLPAEFIITLGESDAPDIVEGAPGGEHCRPWVADPEALLCTWGYPGEGELGWVHVQAPGYEEAIAILPVHSDECGSTPEGPDEIVLEPLPSG